MARKGRNRAPEWYTFTSAFLVHFYFVDNIFIHLECYRKGRVPSFDSVAVIFRAIMGQVFSPRLGHTFSPKLRPVFSATVGHSLSAKLGHDDAG